MKVQAKFTRRTLLAAAAAAMAFATGAAQAQEVIKIGYSGPLSGGAALYGKNVLSGMEMAAAEINAKPLQIGGKNYKVEIVALDDKYNPAETGINVQRLVQQHKTAAVLVPHSGGVFAVQGMNERSNLLLLAYTSLPQVTERGNKLTIRIPPDFTGYIAPFTKAMMTRFGKNVAMVQADHDYAKAWSAAFKPAWEAAGGKIVAENPMSYNKATDFYSGVSRAMQSKPDVMFIGGASEPTALVAKQARELGFKGGFIVLDQAKLDEMAKVVGGIAPLEGAIGVMPLANDTRPEAVAFTERYRKLNPGKDPSTEISLNYSAVHATVAAMKLAGTTTDATAIRGQMEKAFTSLPAMYNPNDIDGLDSKGGTIANVILGTVEGGKIKGQFLRALNAGK
ncbi:MULTISPECIES: ABC transporter substrate-binding protein [unclassified Massilia]|uniref:ABC transporter substrate-binding protein n=1 Tax=unclassified Massilia TaxID=2609279 RepID=UPI001781FDE8|nr:MULTISPECIES: ABC transporter substrate-binding protein [unclassified Massilia]MBD8528419.1 ABC transporter substrate-binding protein [Massilia sp. CFBP 13647]MBD8671959.1 ABC transporter substrate-binding protein [Massilia sp. CFBP 13721]